MIDLSKIPDNVILREAARRMALRPGSGRQKVMRLCTKGCGKEFSARDLRKHLPSCDAK